MDNRKDKISQDSNNVNRKVSPKSDSSADGSASFGQNIGRSEDALNEPSSKVKNSSYDRNSSDKMSGNSSRSEGGLNTGPGRGSSGSKWSDDSKNRSSGDTGDGGRH